MESQTKPVTGGCSSERRPREWRSGPPRSCGGPKTSAGLQGGPRRPLGALQEGGLLLLEAVRGAMKHRFRVLERLDLVRARFAAEVKVLQQKVARPVQLLNILAGRQELRGLALLQVLARHDVRLEVRLL